MTKACTIPANFLTEPVNRIFQLLQLLVFQTNHNLELSKTDQNSRDSL